MPFGLCCMCIADLQHCSLCRRSISANFQAHDVMGHPPPGLITHCIGSVVLSSSLNGLYRTKAALLLPELPPFFLVTFSAAKDRTPAFIGATASAFVAQDGPSGRRQNGSACRQSLPARLHPIRMTVRRQARSADGPYRTDSPTQVDVLAPDPSLSSNAADREAASLKAAASASVHCLVSGRESRPASTDPIWGSALSRPAVRSGHSHDSGR